MAPTLPGKMMRTPVALSRRGQFFFCFGMAVLLVACQVGGFREALPAAREIAGNPEEDVLLRKATIHLIGQLGVESDSALLSRCAEENLRLAQAADPARIALSDRLAGRAGPTLTPYE